MIYQPHTMRELLTDLGIGRFNATMMIEPMFIAPATTDGADPAVMLIVGRIQRTLNAMGAQPKLSPTGKIDEMTAYYLSQVAGPEFLHRPWYEVVKAVVAAKKAGKRVTPPQPRNGIVPAKAMGMFDLPDVPGGVITYAVGGYLLYRAFTKKKRS